MTAVTVLTLRSSGDLGTRALGVYSTLLLAQAAAATFVAARNPPANLLQFTTVNIDDVPSVLEQIG